MLNLFYADEQLASVQAELKEDRGVNPELTYAIYAIKIARKFIRQYTDRLRTTRRS